MHIFLDVIGCRLNQSEVEQFANIFRALGHHIVDDPANADLAIVNTCAVTVKAAADSRKQLRRAAREGADKVVATGCWATLHPERALALPGVTGVFVNDEKESLIPEILNLAPEVISELKLVREPLPGSRSRTRAFIKVQEGCDNHCTYCLTKLARGRSQSRVLNEITADIQAALAGHAKEIVLTGVQLGAWGRDLSEQQSLHHLLAGVLEVGGFDRLRLSSIEPWDLSPDLLTFWKDDRLCRHLHLPLQSGDDHILKAMGRPILTDDYQELVDQVRSEVPDMAITTDVIAGFPGESEAACEATKSFIRKLEFAGGHVFTYSPRPGTAANKMKQHVPVPTAKARNAALRKVFSETGHAYRDQFLGCRLSVLWESSDRSDDGSWSLSGLTDTYIRVTTIAEGDYWNRITMTDLQEHHPHRDAVIGQISKTT